MAVTTHEQLERPASSAHLFLRGRVTNVSDPCFMFDSQRLTPTPEESAGYEAVRDSWVDAPNADRERGRIEGRTEPSKPYEMA